MAHSSAHQYALTGLRHSRAGNMPPDNLHTHNKHTLHLVYVQPFDAHYCHMDTAILEHPVPDRVKPSYVIFAPGHSDAQPGVSECPDVKNYK